MNDETRSLETELAALRSEYAEALPQMADRLAAAWDSVRAPGSNADHVHALYRRVHGLAGSGATYGFPHVSEAARVIESYLRPALESGPAVLQGLHPAIDEGIRTLIQRMRDVRAEPPHVFAEPASDRVPPGEGPSRLLYLVENDEGTARDIASQCACFGYSVRILTDAAALPVAVRERRPAAVVLDFVFPVGGLAGVTAAAMLQREVQPHVPLVFISSRSDALSRLLAVRGGGDAFVAKPLDITLLIDTLDSLTRTAPPRPYRILIVEDDPTQAAYFDAILKQAGMESRVVTRALDTFSVFEEFQPDLILLDLYLGVCTGAEMAAAIRQHSAHFGVPIVFISSERNADRQAEAMCAGGDEFLTKPIEPARLVAVAAARAERARSMRSLMLNDWLTGLLNHGALKQMLAREVARAQRHHLPLSVAMIDLDQFKEVNDRWGHAAGDRVLKSLASLLRKRLRASDMPARYGGEEFAIIFPHTDGANARRLLNEIRESWAAVRHRAGDTEFQVTFSGAVSSFPPCSSVTTLLESADRGLYEAKKTGRNRVAESEAPSR